MKVLQEEMDQLDVTISIYTIQIEPMRWIAVTDSFWWITAR